MYVNYIHINIPMILVKCIGRFGTSNNTAKIKI